ncbi:MAG TPA: hypothetical protein VGM94_18465 [Galbitalea sp.]|jgi:hypothetical protein
MSIRLPLSRLRGRIIAAAIATTIVGGAGAAMGTAPAFADTPPVINLSQNGIVWSTGLAGGLFDAFQGAVPGDSATKSFYVKNPLATPVTMRTRAMDVHSSNSQLDTSITVDGKAGGLALAAAVPMASLANCSTLAPDLVVPAHGTAKVSITLAMLDVDGSFAQSRTGGFDVLLTMEDAEAGVGATSCDSSDPTTGTGGGGGTRPPSTPTTPTSSNPSIFTGFSPLAFTGVDLAVPLFAAGMLFAAGILLLIARRRRKERTQS